MASVRDHLKDDKIDVIVDQLDDQATFGIALAEFTKTTLVEAGNRSKFEDTYSGHAFELQHMCVRRELRLWCARIWDKNGHGLPRLADLIRTRGPEIGAARRVAHPDWSDKLLGLPTLEADIAQVCSKVTEIANSDLISRLKLVRDEQDAHLLAGNSGQRRKFFKSRDDEGYAYNELLELEATTTELIAAFVLIWRFTSHLVENTRRIHAKYYRSYWNLTPNYGELESN